MAIVSDRSDFADTEISVGPKTALTAFYILIGVIAIALAIPAALATVDAGMFEECFSACGAAVQ